MVPFGRPSVHGHFIRAILLTIMPFDSYYWRIHTSKQIEWHFLANFNKRRAQNPTKDGEKERKKRSSNKKQRMFQALSNAGRLIQIRYLITDVPDAPERPLITSFTSRSMNLSWAHSQEARNADVKHYLIETRWVDVWRNNDIFVGTVDFACNLVLSQSESIAFTSPLLCPVDWSHPKYNATHSPTQSFINSFTGRAFHTVRFNWWTPAQAHNVTMYWITIIDNYQ